MEATNKTLIRILKNKLSDKKGTWVKELPRVLWAYRITVRTLTGETPFTLTYSHEVMPQVEIRIPTYRVQHFKKDSNNERLEEQLDLLEEVKPEAEVRIVVNKRRME